MSAGIDESALPPPGPSKCDKRRSISQARSQFPAIDFSLIATEEDAWWDKQRVPETENAVQERALKFLQVGRSGERYRASCLWFNIDRTPATSMS